MKSESYNIDEYIIIIDFFESDDDFDKMYFAITPTKEMQVLDTTRIVNDVDIREFINYHEEFGRFPTRKDHPTNMVGGLNAKRINEIRGIFEK